MAGCSFKESQVTFDTKGKASRQTEQQTQRPASEVAGAAPGTAPWGGLGEWQAVGSDREWRKPAGALGSQSPALALPLTSRVWS